MCLCACACVHIFSCETSMTGAVNYEQFVQLLNWTIPCPEREGQRCKTTMGTGLLLGISFTSCHIHLTHYHITGHCRVHCFVEWRPALPWSPPSTTAPCSLTWHSSRPTFMNKTDLCACIHSFKTQKLATRQVLYTMQECIRTGVRACNSNRSL